MLSDGKFVVLFNFFDLSGHLTGQQKVGEFSVSGGSITTTDGIVHNMLPIGPVSAQTEWRVMYGLNNGFYEVRYEQGFRPRPLGKSESPIQAKVKRALHTSESGRRVASVAVVNPHTDEIMMGRRNDNGLWTMPGGHLHPTETPEDGAKRELLEETGIEAQGLHFMGARDVVSEKGQLRIYSFFLSADPNAVNTEQDPDEEVQEWRWVSRHTVKYLNDENQLHVPLDNNVTLGFLGLKPTDALQKADKINEPDKKENSAPWFDEMHKKLHSGWVRSRHDKTYNAEDLLRYLKHAMLIGQHVDSAVNNVISHPAHTSEHIGEILSHGDMIPKAYRSSIGHSLFTKGHFSDKQVQDLLDEEVNRGSLKFEAQGPFRNTKPSLTFPKNPSLSGESIRQVANHLDEHKWVAPDAYRNRALAQLLANPKAPPELMDQHIDYSYPAGPNGDQSKEAIRMAIAKNPNVPEDVLHKIAGNEKNNWIKDAASHSLRRHGVFNPEEQGVKVAFGTSKLRQVRDWIGAHGGEMNAKELKAAGLDVDAMGLSKIKGPKGTITSQAVQQHIDRQPQFEYGVTHSTYGYDPDDTSYDDPIHPEYNKYSDFIETDENGEKIFNEDSFSPIDEQRHSRDKSQVLQINLTPEHMKRLKDAGVWDTVQKMTDSSVKSGHPVSPVHGIGWVRYTEKPDGIFIDEIQSDIGDSLVKKTKAIAASRVAKGNMTASEAQDAITQAEEIYPEGHHQKIKDIAFAGKDPNEVLHEAFHEHMRQNGKVGLPIHMWQGHSKGHISLAAGDRKTKPEELKGKLPAHMQRTYDQTPKKLGYTPAKYGELQTQSTKQLQGHDTNKTTLRKSESLYPTELGQIHDNGIHVALHHPFVKDMSGKKKIVWGATPEHAKKIDDQIAHQKSAFLGTFPSHHQPIVSSFIDRVMGSNTRHIVYGFDGPKQAIRARMLGSLMRGDTNTTLTVHSPDNLTFTVHKRHGNKAIGQSVWNYSQMHGIQHVGQK